MGVCVCVYCIFVLKILAAGGILILFLFLLKNRKYFEYSFTKMVIWGKQADVMAKNTISKYKKKKITLLQYIHIHRMKKESFVWLFKVIEQHVLPT